MRKDSRSSARPKQPDTRPSKTRSGEPAYNPQAPTPTWMGNRNYIQSHLKRCKDCGTIDYRLLTFHHREPQHKRWNVKQMVAGSFSKSLIDTEIAKCDVLCYNCHQIRHWEMRRERRRQKG